MKPGGTDRAQCGKPEPASASGVFLACSMIVGTLLLVGLSAATSWGACKEESFAGRLFLPEAVAAEFDARIRYFGHNFFQIITKRGTRIVTDPLAPGWYPTPSLEANVITIGREHENHNWTPVVGGNPLILRGMNALEDDWRRVKTSVNEVTIESIPIYVRTPGGGLVKGAAFVFDLGRLCIAHLGDLGHKLSAKQVKSFGKVDIALVPIGGWTTMGPATARDVVQQLEPHIAIPMHYRDDMTRVKQFVRGFPTRMIANNTLTISKPALPAKSEMVVLRYPGGP